MNSTKQTDQIVDPRIEKFFKEYILPLHLEAKKGNRSYFHLRPDKEMTSDGSYFESPIDSNFTYYSFYKMSSEAELKNNLSELWKALGDDDLIELADSLSKLAIIFKEEQVEQTDELSPYVYAMF